jgi:hypothetical protein
MPPEKPRDPKTPGDDGWPEAEEDFRVLASRDGAARRVQEYARRCARGSKYPPQDIAQATVLAILKQGEELLATKNPRAWVQTIVDRKITDFRRKEEKANNAVEKAREIAESTEYIIDRPRPAPPGGAEPTTDELHVLLDLEAAFTEWCSATAPLGQPILVQLRRLTEAAHNAGRNPDWDEVIPCIAKILTSKPGIVRKSLAQLMRRIGYDIDRDAWKRKREDHLFLPLLETAIRSLIAGGRGVHLFEARRHPRLPAGPGVHLQVLVKGGEILRGIVLDISEGGLRFRATAPGDRDGVRLTDRIFAAGSGERAFVIVPPEPSKLPEISFRGRVVQTRLVDRDYECGVEISGEASRDLRDFLRYLGATEGY